MTAGLLLRLCATACVTLLVGCVSLQGTTHSHTASILFSVKLCGDSPPGWQPTGLIVSIESKQGRGGGQFAFTANSQLPGYYTTFLARLDLPPGRYRLSRLSATTANGATTSQFDVSLGMLFDVRSRSPEYIGHIELTDAHTAGASAVATTRAVIADAYDSELPSFLHAWPSLRGREIERRALATITAIPVRLAERAERAPIPSPESRFPVEPAPAASSAARLELRDAQGLPPQALRAFESFLHSGYPRAFTLAASGDTGMAVGGQDVIGRAMSDCKRAQPGARKASCRLFALDDTLVSSIQAVGLPR
jgi:hypothetical protein